MTGEAGTAFGIKKCRHPWRRVRGQARKLTKQGDPELRRLLYLAAMQAKRQPAWQGFYQRYIERGMAPVQAPTILARKLARAAFALMSNQSEYDPLRRLQTQTLMPC